MSPLLVLCFSLATPSLGQNYPPGLDSLLYDKLLYEDYQDYQEDDYNYQDGDYLDYHQAKRDSQYEDDEDYPATASSSSLNSVQTNFSPSPQHSYGYLHPAPTSLPRHHSPSLPYPPSSYHSYPVTPYVTPLPPTAPPYLPPSPPKTSFIEPALTYAPPSSPALPYHTPQQPQQYHHLPAYISNGLNPLYSLAHIYTDYDHQSLYSPYHSPYSPQQQYSPPQPAVAYSPPPQPAVAYSPPPQPAVAYSPQPQPPPQPAVSYSPQPQPQPAVSYSPPLHQRPRLQFSDKLPPVPDLPRTPQPALPTPANTVFQPAAAPSPRPASLSPSLFQPATPSPRPASLFQPVSLTPQLQPLLAGPPPPEDSHSHRQPKHHRGHPAKSSALQNLYNIAGDNWDAGGNIEENLIRSNKDFACPAYEGHFGDPAGDCTVYYACAHGTANRLFCTAGLHWNTVTDQCDWPDNVDCQLNTGQKQQQPFLFRH